MTATGARYLGTKDGSEDMVEVSKDLQTIETRTGGPGGGGPGGGEEPAPTATESTTSTT